MDIWEFYQGNPPEPEDFECYECGITKHISDMSDIWQGLCTQCAKDLDLFDAMASFKW